MVDREHAPRKGVPLYILKARKKLLARERHEAEELRVVETLLGLRLKTRAQERSRLGLLLRKRDTLRLYPMSKHMTCEVDFSVATR
jgi:hypothetical protein